MLSGCQGVKIRDILDASEAKPPPDAHVLWATQDHPPPAKVINVQSLHRPSSYPDRLRMTYFECNAPGTTGYSVATDGVSTVSIHTHRQDDDDVGFYKDVGSDFHWIYMPLDEGEYLTEICRRYGLYVYTGAFALMVSNMFLTELQS